MDTIAHTCIPTALSWRYYNVFSKPRGSHSFLNMFSVAPHAMRSDNSFIETPAPLQSSYVPPQARTEEWLSTATTTLGTSSTLFLPPRGSPARSARACLACRKRKVKCLAGSTEGAPCERCSRTAVECIWEPVGKKSIGSPIVAPDCSNSKRAVEANEETIEVEPMEQRG